MGCRSACLCSAAPFMLPRARWQRNPRADGPAPRSVQDGPRVVQAVLRGLGGSSEVACSTRGASGISPHAQAVRCRRTGHGPDGSATLGLKPARAIGATTVFEVVERDSGSRPEGRNCSRAALGAPPHDQAVQRRSPCQGRHGSATLGLTASRHGRMHKRLGCCRQCCVGLGVAKRVVTAHGVHLASLHAPKQYGAVEQAMGRMVAQPLGSSLPGPSAPRRSSR